MNLNHRLAVNELEPGCRGAHRPAIGPYHDHGRPHPRNLCQGPNVVLRDAVALDTDRRMLSIREQQAREPIHNHLAQMIGNRGTAELDRKRGTRIVVARGQEPSRGNRLCINALRLLSPVPIDLSGAVLLASISGPQAVHLLLTRREPKPRHTAHHLWSQSSLHLPCRIRLKPRPAAHSSVSMMPSTTSACSM